MKNKILIIITILSFIVILIYLHSNIGLKSLENAVSNIALPESIEKITIKSDIGDSGGNGDYSTFRVVLVVKTKMNITELKQEFENMNLKFPKHYTSRGNTPIFYITNCKSNVFKSSKDFSITFNELANIEDYTDYYFVEFVE